MAINGQSKLFLFFLLSRFFSWLAAGTWKCNGNSDNKCENSENFEQRKTHLISFGWIVYGTSMFLCNSDSII